MPPFRERVPGLASLIVTVFAGFSLAASANGQSWPTISMSPPITGFNEPVHITNAGDGSGRLFVSEEHGRILIVKNGVVSSTPFMDLSTRVGSHHVHGVAFPPNYASRKHFYVKYTDAACNIVLSRFGLTANPDVADLNSEQIVLSFTHLPGDCDHSGSAPAFSPVDGFLYTAVGNGTETASNPIDTSQDPGRFLGKTLRIDVETGNPATYTVPATNPFISTPGYLPEIWQLGWRNPWRMSFDRQTGDLFIGDVGESISEEINFQAAASTGGENFGWRIMEGAHCFDGGTCNTAGLTMPVVEYDHSQGCSVTGGSVYRGATYPGMQGIYFYGDYCSGRIWGLVQPGGVPETALLLDTALAIVSFGESEAGELFVADHTVGGAIYAIQGTPPVPTDLEIRMIDSPDPVMQNGQVTYDIEVTNLGPGPANGVKVTDSIPAGTFISATSSGMTCVGMRTVSCTTPTIASGASVAITLVVKATTLGTLSNTATVEANEPDTDATNNSSTQTTDVLEFVKFGATSYSVAEGGTSVAVTVTRTGSRAISVGYATGNNTATAGSDYGAVSGRLDFAVGEVSKSFTIPVTNDLLAEGNESLNVTLSAPIGALLGTNRNAVVTITDDDVASKLEVAFSTTSYSKGEANASATITIVRTGDTSGTVGVDWSAVSNTATAGTDFTAPGGTLTFSAGVTSRTFTVAITNDTAAEGNVSALLLLSNPTGGATLSPTRRAAPLTIVDNDVPASGFRFQSAATTTQETGSKAIVVARTSSSVAQSVTVSTSNGTAVAGADYTAVTTTLSFAIGETSKTVNIPILTDTQVEGNETVNLTLSNPTNGGTLGAGRRALLIIVDNDNYGTLNFKTLTFTVAESGPTATITATRTGNTAHAVGVSYATSNNTATEGLDYVATSGTLSFAVGQTSRTFTIPIINDTAPDGNESLNLTLSNPTGGVVLGQGQRAILTITDND